MHQRVPCQAVQGDKVGPACETSADEPDFFHQVGGPIFGYEESLTSVRGK